MSRGFEVYGRGRCASLMANICGIQSTLAVEVEQHSEYERLKEAKAIFLEWDVACRKVSR